MTIKVNGKKITKAKAIEMLGKKRMEARIAEAKEDHEGDPLMLHYWMDGMMIEF